jgi:hypothetical protein
MLSVWMLFWFSCYVLQAAGDENQADVGMDTDDGDGNDSDYESAMSHVLLFSLP